MTVTTFMTIIFTSYILGVEAVKFSENDLTAVVNDVLKVKHDIDALKRSSEDPNGCDCVNYNCGCCVHMVIKKVEFDETVCVNISYLPDEYGVRVTMDINGLFLINQTISAKNPPPFCVGVPHVKELSLCLRFYNLSISNHSFSGCAEIEVHLIHILQEKYPLGCFKVGNDRVPGRGIWLKDVRSKTEERMADFQKLFRSGRLVKQSPIVVPVP